MIVDRKSGARSPEIWFKLEADSKYVPSDQELTSKKELIDYYFDPKQFLEQKFN